MNKTQKLQQELRAAGASAHEARELSGLALQLKGLEGGQVAAGRKNWKLTWMRHLPVAAALLLCVLVGMATVTFSQASLPGSMLYPVKRLSENSLASVHPGFKGTMMMRRAQEVKTLVASHASDDTILATLSDYQREAAAYKTSNYAVFEYCKDSLTAAVPGATPAVQRAINDTLKSLQAV